MIKVSEVSASEFILRNFDYPENYIYKKHPEDGKKSNEPIVPEFIRHRKLAHHRLLFRVSFKLSDNEFVPFTFMCDTGGPSHFYLSCETITILQKEGRIKVSELGQRFMIVQDKLVLVNEIPFYHEPGNIMGLWMLERLGMVVNEEGFSFLNKFDYF